MTNVLEPHDYNKSVFINCPFDSAYEPLFRGLVFAVRHMNLVPKSALDASDVGQPRFDKILDLIENCKYSIHDISRTEIDPDYGLPRFNVPFELGLDLGCKRSGFSIGAAENVRRPEVGCRQSSIRGLLMGGL